MRVWGLEMHASNSSAAAQWWAVISIKLHLRVCNPSETIHLLGFFPLFQEII